MKKVTTTAAIFLMVVFVALFASCGSSGITMIEIPSTNFYMSQTEVTQKQYQYVTGDKPSWHQQSNKNRDFIKNEKYKIKMNTSNYPVEQVSWYDAIYFCNKLSVKERKTPVYAVDGETDVEKWNYTTHQKKGIDGTITLNLSADGYRLPTLDEWRYAAMGAENFAYAGSNNPNEVAWFGKNSDRVVHPVAEKKANGYGLYDMSGNVDEWCWETSDKSEGLRRAIVCGGWYIQNDDKLKLNECSSDALKGAKYGCIGFRVVCARSE